MPRTVNNGNSRVSDLRLQESHELNKIPSWQRLYCDVVLLWGSRAADRSWNLWDVCEKQKLECYTEFSVTLRSQVREEKKRFGGRHQTGSCLESL